jgi:fatty-acyl-CoA synthase
VTTDTSLASDVATARRHTIGDLLRRSALRHPDKPAIVYRDVRQAYAELDDTVNRTASALIERGVGKGDPIAILSHNSHGFVVGYLALARLGAISVPINFMLSPGEVAYILDHSGAHGVIAEDQLCATADRAIEISQLTDVQVRGVIGEPVAGWEDVSDWMRHQDNREPALDIADDHPLQLLYTSGTESRPKGVMLTSRNLIAQYVSCALDGEMTGDDIEVHSLPLYHCAQLHCFLTTDLYLGATSVILDTPDPSLLLGAIERERATKLFCPPTVWISLLRSPEFDGRDLSSLRKGYYGASSMPVEVLQELTRRLPDVRLYNFYGQTEMSPLATVLRPEDQMRKAGSAGRPSINVETRLVDNDDLPVPAGSVGEIVHRSPHAMLGYWNDPGKTADAFRGGWFHSGDLAVMDGEGYITIVDRKKDMINTGGENVSSREVEEVIYEHPKVAEVAVFGVAHPRWIEAVTAGVVPRGSETVSQVEIIELCKQRLAPFKVPKYVVILEELPKNPSGKILKRELRTAYGNLAEGTLVS